MTANKNVTLSVRIEPAVKKGLEQLAKHTGRSGSFLAAQAIDEYLTVQKWQVEGVIKAIASIKAGKGVSHKEVKKWVASWGTKKELSRPRARAI